MLLKLFSIPEYGDYVEPYCPDDFINTPSLQEAGDGFIHEMKITKRPKIFFKKENFCTIATACVTKDIMHNDLWSSHFRYDLNRFKKGSVHLELYLPSGFDRKMPRNFLQDCFSLKSVTIYGLKQAPDNFLRDCTELVFFEAPDLRETSRNFLRGCVGLECFNAPCLQKVGRNFLRDCAGLEYLELYCLREINEGFLQNCVNLSELRANNIKKFGEDFAYGKQFLSFPEIPGIAGVWWGY
jgi:hypothetical protein